MTETDTDGDVIHVVVKGGEAADVLRRTLDHFSSPYLAVVAIKAAGIVRAEKVFAGCEGHEEHVRAADAAARRLAAHTLQQMAEVEEE